MIRVDSNKNIRINRGDSGTLVFSASVEQTGDDYTFEVGDIVRLNVTKANKENEVVLSKDVTVSEESTTVEMALDSSDNGAARLLVGGTIVVLYAGTGAGDVQPHRFALRSRHGCL